MSDSPLRIAAICTCWSKNSCALTTRPLSLFLPFLAGRGCTDCTALQLLPKLLGR